MQTANNNDEAAIAAEKSSVTATTPSSAVSSPLQPPPTEEEIAKAKQDEEWHTELTRLEYEIQTLRNVLTVKVEEATELKRKLGITAMGELKQDFTKGMQTIKESETVQKTSAAFKSFGDFASRKLGDIRNSNTFKSVEEKVGVAVSSVKKRVSRSDSLPEDATAVSLNNQMPTTDDSEELTAMLPESGKATITINDKPAV